MAFCMSSVFGNKFYKKVRTLVLGGEAGRVKLTTPPKGIEVFRYRSVFAFGSI